MTVDELVNDELTDHCIGLILLIHWLFVMTPPPAAVCQAAGGEGRDPRHPGGPHPGAAGVRADPERADQGPEAQVGIDAGAASDL